MEEDTALEDVDNPRWQLFETIKTTTNNQGRIRLYFPWFVWGEGMALQAGRLQVGDPMR
jgi:hypothetical protein